MKKISMIAIALLAALSFASCSKIENDGPTGSAVVSESSQPPQSTAVSSVAESKTESNAESKAESEEESKTEEPVDKNSVNIKVPDYLLSDDENGELTDDQISAGFRSSKKNEDGSITYTLKKDSYDDYVQSVKENVTSMLDEMKDGEYSSIQDVKYDSDLKQVVLYVDQTAYENSSDSYAIKGIGSQAALYHIYNGEDAGKIEVVIQIENAETNEVLETAVYPERS